MLYTLAATRWTKSRAPHQHQQGNGSTDDDASEDPLLAADRHGPSPSSSKPPRGRPLRGAHILLMWLPALCDLSGTTVRIFPFPFFLFPPSSLPSFPSYLPTFPPLPHLRAIAISV